MTALHGGLCSCDRCWNRRIRLRNRRHAFKEAALAFLIGGMVVAIAWIALWSSQP